MTSLFRLVSTIFALSAACLLPAGSAQSTTSNHPAPRIVEQAGRHALLVDDAPYLVLGAQINNSSAWPSELSKVWPALAEIHANTVEAPVYWEQLEATPGQYDFSIVDQLIEGARTHDLHLILLWFGTWKNGEMHYVPDWIKTDTVKYPRVINAAGEPIDVLSADGAATLQADQKAFTALMLHLAAVDSQAHTILMVQLENESGIIGSPRDFAPAANRAFNAPVPPELLRDLHIKTSGNWREVFADRAEEAFQAYSQARYINQIAEAGKRAFNIPIYCNVWVSYPIKELPERQVPQPGLGYPSGGPAQRILPMWKALTPSVDVIAPDIYSDDRAFDESLFSTYSRPDNALWIPEVGRGDSFAPLLFEALGHGAIGLSPFGVDWVSGKDSSPLAKEHGINFALLSPMSRELARLNFEGKLQTAVEAPGMEVQDLQFGPWHASLRFGFPQHDGAPPPGDSDRSGRALIAQLGPDEFLITGVNVSFAFHVADRLPGFRMQILSAEEGTYVQGKWQKIRLLNGDQTDRGINFHQQPTTAVRVRLGAF
jgi:hypothetical protein